jgi:hypothetical protein
MVGFKYARFHTCSLHWLNAFVGRYWIVLPAARLLWSRRARIICDPFLGSKLHALEHPHFLKLTICYWQQIHCSKACFKLIFRELFSFDSFNVFALGIDNILGKHVDFQHGLNTDSVFVKIDGLGAATFQLEASSTTKTLSCSLESRYGLYSTEYFFLHNGKVLRDKVTLFGMSNSQSDTLPNLIARSAGSQRQESATLALFM